MTEAVVAATWKKTTPTRLLLQSLIKSEQLATTLRVYLLRHRYTDS